VSFPPLEPAAPPPDLTTAETVEKGHGRIEIRRIAVSAEVIPHIAWPGAAQIAHIERTRWIGGKLSMETATIITSLDPTQAGPERLLELSRKHWAIENRLHYVRDVSFNEDRCRVRAGARPLATIRNLVLHLIRRSGRSIPEARENFREDRVEAIAAVTGRFL